MVLKKVWEKCRPLCTKTGLPLSIFVFKFILHKSFEDNQSDLRFLNSIKLYYMSDLDEDLSSPWLNGLTCIFQTRKIAIEFLRTMLLLSSAPNRLWSAKKFWLGIGFHILLWFVRKTRMFWLYFLREIHKWRFLRGRKLDFLEWKGDF